MKYLQNVTSLELSPEKCTGCGRCVDVCPHGVFVIKDKKASITDKDLCMECGACALNCEFGAISVNSGVGCAAAIINGMITGGPPSCDCGGSPSQSASSNCC
ncbi:MAG: mercury methylation ferredoxin HgcB [Thermodesulfovibrionales bacterium]|jgi:NAD-dependent dihydropyrimidine dehydrogenase PreA subunit|nr:mercury methylation ferredoxin HgcB [Thermodesulfovibrionales bacterium]